MDFDPAFWRLFGTWLHSDTLEHLELSHMLDQADTAAAAMGEEISDLRPLVEALKRYLIDRPSDVTLKLIDATNIDWLASEEQERDLRLILERILLLLEEERARRH